MNLWDKSCVVLFFFMIIKSREKGGNPIAKNKPYGDNARVGAVKGRSQVYNPKTDSWVKRDTTTGRFMDVKTSSNSPFKGVRKEK